ncbi:hypothetical protein E2562_038371, partial [Oryza meyeriana var. granulata]
AATALTDISEEPNTLRTMELPLDEGMTDRQVDLFIDEICAREGAPLLEDV